ncbi:MAG TPA: uracil-DNA glycosylase, partial [Mycobacterium sp.]
PKFGHGAHVVLPPTDDGSALEVFGCFHVSQQNTFTGRLTPEMMDDVFATALAISAR